MERTSAVNHRHFRGRAVIVELLEAHRQSGLSIKDFCVNRCIPEGSFHNWRRRYGKENTASVSSSFAPIQLNTGSASLFAEVNGIKLYQPVSAAYLKELCS
ncbi:IS66 family insertion sequence element accessory protein TnpA [Filimonas effusa]|uniref:Transposase n=1 Tax=Filimonas effusa TaxID=2508721 RepID=A0A4Q1D1U3_9BACT|nr:hypothetical protein ESB13_18775 [Filimonas effusa]